MVTSPINTSRNQASPTACQCSGAQTSNGAYSSNMCNLYSAIFPHTIDTLQSSRDPHLVWFKSTNRWSSLLCIHAHTECICQPSTSKQALNRKKVKRPVTYLHQCWELECSPHRGNHVGTPPLTLSKKVLLTYIRKILKHFWSDASVHVPGHCLHSCFATTWLARQSPGQARCFKAKRSRKLKGNSWRISNGQLIQLLTSLGGSPW